ncbi:MAG: hypothetical protein LBK50_03695 [Candidatus Nomurabacteria bacterium]|jgi:ribose-phosphate pyrophosphokinase|nr:hypothetical protein [Candidatus Nomurabacteria bacterium]
MSIYVNGSLVKWGKGHFDGAFPSGELKPTEQWVPDQEHNFIKWFYLQDGGGDEEFYYISIIVRDLKKSAPNAKNILWMEFIPNARLDKSRGADGNLLPCNEYNADYINELGFTKVYGVEPHSEAFEENYRNAIPVYPTVTGLIDVRNALTTNRNIQWIFPDKGAFARYKGQLPGVTEDDIIIIGKHRTDGSIDKTEIESGSPRPGYDLVIVDDLCSRGGTFYGAAQKLRAAGADGDIYLVISHLEPNVFSGHLIKDDSPIARIFVCTKSLGELLHSRITYLNPDYQKEAEIC